MQKFPTVKKALLASVGLTAIIIPDIAAAQSDADDDDVIVVTAQRREQSVQEIPFTVNAVSSESMKNASVTDVFSLQSQVPGLDIRSTNPPSAGAAFVIRGLGTGVFNLGFEPSVGTFIDGVYRARSGIVASSDFLDLERVEVLKGPQGTLFGKNTTAGIINFITAKPDMDDYAGRIRADYGNYDRVNVQGMLNVPLGDSAAFRISGLFTDDEGYITDAATGDGYGEKDRWMLRGQFLFEPSENVSVRIIGDYAKADENTIIGIPSSVDAADAPFNQMLATAAGSVFFATPTDTLRTTAVNTPPSLEAEDYGISAEINLALGAFDVTSLTSYREFNDLLISDNDFVGTDILNTRQGETIDTFTQELRISTNLGENIDFMVGGYFSDEDITRLNEFIWGPQVGMGFVGFVFGTMPGVGFTDNMGQSAQNYGLFAHAITEIDRLTLTTGLRYSWDDKEGFGTFSAPQSFPLPIVYDYGPGTTVPAVVNDSGLSATVSLSYAVNDALNVYGTYSRGYKGGGISLIRDAGGVLLGVNAPGAPVPAGCLAGPFPGTISCTPSDPTFDKETTDHYELGIKSRFWDNSALANIAFFYTDVSNLQTQNLLPSGTFNVINIGSATSQGFDVELGYSPFDGFDLNGGFVYAKTEDNLGNTLDHAPRWTGVAGVTYETALTAAMSAFAHFDVNIKDSYLTSTPALPFAQEAFVTANARVGVRFDDGRYEVSGWCRNCFDEHYRTIDFQIPLDGAGVNFDGASVLSFIGEPRFYGVTLEASF